MQQSLDNAPPHTHTLIHHDNRLRTLTEKYTLASTKEGNHRAFPIGTLTRNEAIHHSHTHTHTYTHTHSHTQRDTHTNRQTDTHRYTHTDRQTHARARTHTHTHKHT